MTDQALEIKEAVMRKEFEEAIRGHTKKIATCIDETHQNGRCTLTQFFPAPIRTGEKTATRLTYLSIYINFTTTNFQPIKFV